MTVGRAAQATFVVGLAVVLDDETERCVDDHDPCSLSSRSALLTHALEPTSSPSKAGSSRR